MLQHNWKNHLIIISEVTTHICYHYFDQFVLFYGLFENFFIIENEKKFFLGIGNIS